MFVAGRNEKESAADFFQNIMATTSTLVLWPSKLKIGAKSKKGPIPIPPFSIPSFFHAPFLHFPIISFFHTPFLHSLFPHSFIPHSPILHSLIFPPFPDPQVKVVGLPGNVQKARELILGDLDAKSERVTLKIDVPFSDHSHVIGKEGANIKKGNFSNQDTNGAKESVIVSEVSSFQKCTQEWYLGEKRCPV